MWPPLGCVKCDNSTLTDMASSFYSFLPLLSNLYCTPTTAKRDLEVKPLKIEIRYAILNNITLTLYKELLLWRESMVTFEENYIFRNNRSITSNSDIALTEFVANAWDAGAHNVDITIPLEPV